MTANQRLEMILLGFSQQLDKVDISSIPIMSTRVPVSDLGVIIEPPNHGDQVAAVSLWLYYQLLQLR